MNFLTIEKFEPQTRLGLFKKIILTVLGLVILASIAGAWIWSRLNALEFSRQSSINEVVKEKNIIAKSDYN